MYALRLSECAQDTPSARSCLQRNEDKIDDFSKWSAALVRFVKSILEEAERMSQLLPNLELQICKFSDFQEAFGVDRTVEALETITNLLRNTQSSNHRLVTNIADRLLIPLQNYFQEDFKALKDSRRFFERATEKYEAAISKYSALSKFKDVLELDSELSTLYDARIEYFEQYFDHAAKINDFKQVIDLLFLEKISSLIDELSEFFKTLSDNFLSVKTQMDQVRGEYDRLSQQSREQRQVSKQEKSQQLEKIKAKWNTSAPITHQLSTHKSGHLYLRRRKALGNPWKRVYASIVNGTFTFEAIGRSRGALEQGDQVNLMLCEIRPIELNERRFCFEIYSGSQQQGSLILQAESEDEMMDWVNTFHTAKSDLLEQRSKPTVSVPEPVKEPLPPTSNELPPILKKWNEELQKHFKLTHEEELALCSFPASLHTDIWTQGRVFVTQYAVYFFSSLFGIGKKIIIPLRDVVKIDVIESSFVTLLNFTMSGEADDFTLKTFNTVDDSNTRFIDQLQRLHRNTQSADPKNSQQLMQEMSSSLSVFEMERVGEAAIAVEEGSEVQSVNSTSSDSSSKGGSDVTVTGVGVGSTIAITKPTSSTTTPSVNAQFTLINKNAPEILCGCSSHMDKRQVNTVIPIDCDTAFDLMFGPNCPVQHSVQSKRKNRDYKITPWKTNTDGLQERQESFIFPLNNPLVRLKETECYVTIRLTKNEPGRCYVIDCQTNAPNIPYADSFFTRTRYCITHAGPDQTRLSICLGITWLKSPFVKSIIKAATFKTFEDFCVDYLACLRKEMMAAGRINSAEKTTEEGGMVEAIQVPIEESAVTIEPSTSELDRSRIPKVVLFYALPLLVAFLLGHFTNRKRLPLHSGIYPNNSNSNTTSTPSYWHNQKLQKSHFRLQSLHPEFSLIRTQLLDSLSRLDALEAKVWEAQRVAILGDQLLSCSNKEDQECSKLKREWQRSLN